MSRTRPPSVKVCPPMLWRCPATDTLSWLSRAKARARETSSTVWTFTIPQTGVLFRQLASLIKPPFTSNGRGLGGGETIRVVGLELVESVGKAKSQSFSRSGGDEESRAFLPLKRAKNAKRNEA